MLKLKIGGIAKLSNNRDFMQELHYVNRLYKFLSAGPDA